MIAGPVALVMLVLTFVCSLAVPNRTGDLLAAETAAGIQRYRDPAQAVADGYRPVTPLNAPTVEWVNPQFVRAGRVLDPRRPERLMYVNTWHGLVVAGAMFVLPSAQARPPAWAAALHWHRHRDLCFLPNGTIAGTNGYGFACPRGSAARSTPLMLHVWIVPNPAGRFAADLSPAAVQALQHG